MRKRCAACLHSHAQDVEHPPVPNVLESLIGTILSQNTSNRNSTAAKLSLDQKFGRYNFAAIADAPRKDVVEALKHGGLANKKAGVIQSLLADVKERHGEYSLQHLSKSSDEEVMNGTRMAAVCWALGLSECAELVSYNGVGPKTASCVLLFCLSRDSFAVDTHVFRLSRLLGWVPPRADRVLAQAHLDQRVPAELKYGLHVLMVHHGRSCAGCKSAAGRGKACPLKAWLREKGVKGEEVEEDLVKADEDAKGVAVKEEASGAAAESLKAEEVKEEISGAIADSLKVEEEEPKGYRM
jgi:endonuclease-3